MRRSHAACGRTGGAESAKVGIGEAGGGKVTAGDAESAKVTTCEARRGEWKCDDLAGGEAAESLLARLAVGGSGEVRMGESGGRRGDEWRDGKA
jgi:hypothetical protein